MKHALALLTALLLAPTDTPSDTNGSCGLGAPPLARSKTRLPIRTAPGLRTRSR